MGGQGTYWLLGRRWHNRGLPGEKDPLKTAAKEGRFRGGYRDESSLHPGIQSTEKLIKPLSLDLKFV